MSEPVMTEKESLELISKMINKAKGSYHDSGIGPILWGCVITVCSIVSWLEMKLHFKLPFDIWLLTLIAILPQIFISVREEKNSKVKSYDDQVMDYVWMTFGVSIFLLIFINTHVIMKLNPVFETYIEVKGAKPEFTYGSFITSFFLMLYGIPTIITGGSRKFKPMLYGGIVCWACCMISVYTNKDWDMLLTAFAAVCAWLIPGIILFNRYRKQKAANV
jgi:hypothetical protein